MIENEQVLRGFVKITEINFLNTLRDLLQRRRFNPRPGQEDTERIDIAAIWQTAQQSRLNNGRASPHEWIINDLAGCREPLDEEAGQLRFETGAIRNLLQVAGRALFGSPEFIHKSGHRQLFA